MIKVKMGDRGEHNHYVNNPRGIVVSPEMVISQVEKYDHLGEYCHLYGAIIASVQDYIRDKKKGRYGEYHLAICAHYAADLSQALHNTEHDAFNKRYHKAVDGTVNDEALDKLAKIKVYPFQINSEEDLANEIARVANLSMTLGYRLEDENRLSTKEEAYVQLRHSASLSRAVLEYATKLIED